MKAAFYEATGPAREVLQVGELPDPTPGPGEVLVRVEASGINPSDTKARSGGGRRAPMRFPRVIPHQDGAGVIVAVGDGVPAARVGQRVWIYEAQLGRPSGTGAELTAVPGRNAVPLPAAVGFDEGACLGVPAMTAHRCVFSDGPVDGQVVLVTGGAGAVGFYAVQFARHGGARVIATVSSDAQAEIARRAGAHLVINRRTGNVVDEIAAFTGVADGRGVDRVIEVAFGANLETTLRVLKRNGIVATFSSDAVPEPTLPYWPLLALDATVRFVLVYAMTAAAHDEAVAYIDRGLGDGWMIHNIAARLPLADVASAHEQVEAPSVSGKVIVTVRERG